MCLSPALVLWIAKQDYEVSLCSAMQPACSSEIRRGTCKTDPAQTPSFPSTANVPYSFPAISSTVRGEPSSIMAFSVSNRFPNSGSASSAETISKLFEDAARTCPQGTAIQFEFSKRVTYQELKYMVDVLASNLQGLVRKNQLVPVLLPRSIQQICVILALAKLGAAYVPLDAGSPDTRLCSIVSAIRAKLIIAETESRNRFKEVNGAEHEYFDPLNCLGEPIKRRASPSFAVAETVRPSDLAAVLFTSGSTGQPKGVMLSHRNLIEPVRLLSQMENIGSRSRLLQFASCAFDVHLLDIFCAMFNSATLCQVSDDNLTSNLSEWIEEMEADVVHLTPSVISLLDCKGTTTLKYMVTCGESVTQAIIQDWSNKVVLINLYGKFHGTILKPLW